MTDRAMIWDQWGHVHKIVATETDENGRVMKKKSKIKEGYKKCKHCGTTRTRKKKGLCNHINECHEEINFNFQ